MSYSAIAMTRHALVLVCLAALDPAAHAGSVKGTVLFEGEPPENKTPKREADPKCGKDRPDEAVVVTKGKLRDVVVRIKNGSTGAHDAPKDPVVLDQHGCDYVPRVVGIVAGQNVVVKNSDATFHNVWGQVAGKDVVNKQQGPKAADLTIDPAAAKPGDVVELKCGVHGWMHAYVAVQDHPFFAVTKEDGTYEIKGLPAGDYEIEAWHEKLKTQSQKVTVKDGEKAKADFSYKS